VTARGAFILGGLRLSHPVKRSFPEWLLNGVELNSAEWVTAPLSLTQPLYDVGRLAKAQKSGT